MEMEGRRLVSKIILDIDDDLITDRSSDDRKWPFSIDTYGGSLESTIGIRGNPTNVEVIDNSTIRCFCDLRQYEKQR